MSRGALHTYFNQCVWRLIPIRLIVHLPVDNGWKARIFHFCEAPLAAIAATVVELGAVLATASHVAFAHCVEDVCKLLPFDVTFIPPIMVLINDGESVVAGLDETARINATDHEVGVVFFRPAIGAPKLLALSLWSVVRNFCTLLHEDIGFVVLTDGGRREAHLVRHYRFIERLELFWCGGDYYTRLHLLVVGNVD